MNEKRRAVCKEDCAHDEGYCQAEELEKAMSEEQKRTRKDWDNYFMDIARAAASRGTCDRKHVGAVIVFDRRVLATGYNGSIRGQPHCDDVGHEMEDGHCVRTVHAEANAILQAAQHGVSIDGAAIYTTASPCYPCFKLIANCGIMKVVFGEMYRDARIYQRAIDAHIELIDMSQPARTT